MAVAAYIGKGATFTAGIVRFARRYADQNERDHAQLVSVIAAGDVESLPGEGAPPGQDSTRRRKLRRPMARNRAPNPTTTG
jgi:Uncharacterized protein conserved in bacteria (DUF2252)